MQQSISIENIDFTKILPFTSMYTKIIYRHFIELSQYPNVQHNEPAIYKMLSSENMFGYVIRSGKKIIGYLFGEFTVLGDGRNVYYLSYVYIAPRYQGHKLGSVLMNKLIKQCHVRGTTFIVLTCDTTDQKVMKFYKKFGFTYDPVLRQNTKHDVLCLYM